MRWSASYGLPPSRSTELRRHNASESAKVTLLQMRLDVALPRQNSQIRGDRSMQAVPPLPAEQVDALVRRHAPWQEMVDLMETAAPSGFVMYLKTEVGRLMSLAGDDASCTSYLMGNHIIAERMFPTHEPAVILYAPL